MSSTIRSSAPRAIIGSAASALPAISTTKPSSTSPCLIESASRASSSINRIRSAFIPPDAATPPHAKKAAYPSNRERQDSGGYQGACPDCVEVDPGAAQDCQADPLIDQDRDCAGHCDHRASVQQHYRYRLRDGVCGSGGHVM